MKAKSNSILKDFEKTTHKILMRTYLYYFYRSYEEQIIENVLYNNPCHFVAVYKDYLIIDDFLEYLRRYYETKESIVRLKKIFIYYHETSVIFPNYTRLVESKYLYDNVIKKQNVIDEQQNLEDYLKVKKNNEKKQEEKRSPLKKIQEIFKNNDNEEEVTRVFDSKVYEEILNTSGESIQRIMFGIDSKSNHNVMRTINDNGSQNYLNEDEKVDENESIKNLLMNLDKYKNINHKRKNIILLKDNKNNLKYSLRIYNNKKFNTLFKDNIPKRNSLQIKRNKIQNANNSKNNYETDKHPYISNGRKNKLFPISNDNFRDKILFNHRMKSNFAFQMFRCSNYASNFNTNNIKNNYNDNSVNNLQQKLIEIFNKKMKNKENSKNDSYNLSLGKIINTSRLNYRNNGYVFHTCQNSITSRNSRRSNSKKYRSDKSISFKNRNKNNSNDLLNKITKRNKNNSSLYHKKMKSQLTINIKTEENKGILRNNHKYLSSIINKQFKTITPSFRRLSNLNINTIKKIPEAIQDYKFKRKSKIDKYNNIPLHL